MRHLCLCQPAAWFRQQPAVLFTLMLPLLLPATASAQHKAVHEGEIKAAFVYNFAKFADWPEEQWTRSPTIRLCTTGSNNPFTAALSSLHRQSSIRGKEIEVMALARPQESSRCHLLVVTGTDSTGEWLRHIRHLPVLTVGDSGRFAASGGAIGLFIEGDKVKFEINPDAVQRAGIKLSSQLLQLAKFVRDEPGAIR